MRHHGNIYSFMRNLGYAPFREAYVRRLGQGDYPRFHAYVSRGRDQLIIDLHLDQKKPIYRGSHAHGGEYEGRLVEEEVKRIRSLV